MILATVALATLAQAKPMEDPAFDLLRTLVGGRWEGSVSEKVKVTFRYSFEQDKNLIVGIGKIDFGTGQDIQIRSSFGWDPGVKKVYYLDQHANDRVLFGHATRSENRLQFEFKTLTGAPNNYRMEMVFSGDSFEASMSAPKGEEWREVMKYTMKRRR